MRTRRVKQRWLALLSRIHKYMIAPKVWSCRCAEPTTLVDDYPCPTYRRCHNPDMCSYHAPIRGLSWFVNLSGLLSARSGALLLRLALLLVGFVYPEVDYV